MGKINYWQNLEENVTYHVYNQSIGEADLFYSGENYIYFLQKWTKYLNVYLDVFAYCLMPNHFHFLVRVRPIDATVMEQVKKENTVAAEKFLQKEISYNTFLEDQFKRLFSSYSLAVNKQRDRKGSLLRKRFKRVSVNGDEKILEKLCYVHHNPIHHGFTTHYDEWIYSSYIAYFSEKPSKVNRMEMLNMYDRLTKLPKFGKPDTMNMFAKLPRFSKREDCENVVKKLKQEHEDYRQRRINDYLDNDDF